MTSSDQMELKFYDYTHAQRVNETERCDLYRVALLAAQYRMMLIERERTARAVARATAERKALIGASRDHSPGGEGCLSLGSRQSGEDTP